MKKNRDRRHFFWSLLVILAASPMGIAAADVGSDADKSGAPKIEIEAPSWDFGEIEEGDAPEHIFKINNSGSKDLLITKLHSGCPCIKSELSRNNIPPDQEAELKLTYFSEGSKPGKDNWNVLIFSNDPSAPVSEVKFDVNVVIPAKDSAVQKQAPQDIPHISSDELYSRLKKKEGVVLLDVRSSEKFTKSHIKGAMNIPLSELENNLAQIPIDKEIVIYCGGMKCKASTKAGRILLKRGYRQGLIKVYKDGYRGWKDKGYPLEPDIVD